MRGRILIVDDEATARITLAEILELEQYRVSVADSGEMALDYLERESFDLMLLDIKMPGIDGVEVLKTSARHNPDCKIILLTAHGSLESAIEAVRLGAHDYLLKPASPGQILSSVNRAMTERADADRRRRLIEQMEASLRQLKDVEGLEKETAAVSPVVTLGDGVMVDLERREIWKGETKVTFTPTEGKLMKVLLENRGRVMSHKELVLLVQGYKTTDYEAPEILRPLVSRLRRKLAEFPDGKEWISNVRGTGYVFDKE
ncbi:MAG TPA: response regulator transcription factor [Anaerolineales bacterium]|nr:response regulator transcription factor [Anaerolineales bacterium]